MLNNNFAVKHSMSISFNPTIEICILLFEFICCLFLPVFRHHFFPLASISPDSPITSAFSLPPAFHVPRALIHFILKMGNVYALLEADDCLRSIVKLL